MTTLRFSLSKILVIAILLMVGAVASSHAGSLTLTSASLDTSGRIVTLNIGGSSGGLSPSTGVTGFTVADTSPVNYSPVIASVTATGTTVTINLSSIVQTGDVITVSYAAGGNLTDGSANTLPAVTNQAVTNGSSQSGTMLNVVDNGANIEENAEATLLTGWFGQNATNQAGRQFVGDGYDFGYEFVANCTSLEARGYISGSPYTVSVDGAAPTSVNTAQTGNGYLVLAAGLAAGTHLFRINNEGSNGYTNGFRLTGGTQSVVSSFSSKKALFSNNQSFINFANAVSPITSWGTFRSSSPFGTGLYQGQYNGFICEFGFMGTDVDIACIVDFNQGAVSVDNGPDQLVTLGSPSNTGGLAYFRVAQGLTPGYHTLRFIQVAGAYNSGSHNYEAVRVLNGTQSFAASAAGDTSLTVARAGSLAAGCWVRVGIYAQQEYRQVSAISGTTLTVAALSFAHSAGTPITSLADTPGQIYPWNPDAPKYQKRIVGMGDSNTQGANTYGFGNIPDSNGIFYTSYDVRSCFGYQAAKILGWEWVDVGVQGTDTNNQVSRKPDFMLYGRGSYDFVTILEGTNDINSNSTTPANFGPNVQQQIDAAAPGLRAGGKILLIPEQQSYNQVSPSGLSCPVVNGILRTLAANGATYTGAGTYKNSPYSSFVVYCSHAWDGVNLTTPWNAATNPLGDLETTLHFRPRGQTKLARNLVNYYLSPTRVRNNSRIGTRSGQSD